MSMPKHIQHPPILPTLLYDGDCDFCGYCVDYLRAVTDKDVDYQPYQQQLSRFPDLSAEQCRASIQWLQPDGQVYEGAAAAFLALAQGGQPGWWYAYRWLPGFAVLCEWLYQRVARHRRAAFWLARRLAGQTLQPLRYNSVGKLFVRLLAFIYLCAFLSCALQMEGLYGELGIIPLSQYLPSLELEGVQRWLQLPTVFWFSQQEGFLLAVPVISMIASLLLLLGLWPTANLLVAWLGYLSLVNTGPVFMQYQWDMLLLEVGFIAILSQSLPRLGVWLYRWLLFRFVWLSGWVKLSSGDPLWANWTALTVHFETQPLPTLIGWFAHQLPAIVLRAATAATLFIELVLPLLIFLPRRLRHLAFWCFALLQTLIFITGNYTFFNILALAISLFLLDDHYLAQRWPGLSRSRPVSATTCASLWGSRLRLAIGTGVTALLLLISLNVFYLAVSERQPRGWQVGLLTATESFHLVSNYGVFAVITRQRPEIILEFSDNGVDWQAFPFRFKPVDLQRAPTWIAPLQPRLDWQLWFAAKQPTPPQWFDSLVFRLLQGSPPVERLLGLSASDDPPRFVRARRYRYQFTTPEERARSGNWWARSYLDLYLPPAQIRMATDDQGDELREIP